MPWTPCFGATGNAQISPGMLQIAPNQKLILKRHSLRAIGHKRESSWGKLDEF